MKPRLAIAIIVAFFTIATGLLLANSHPGDQNNGIGSSRFPNHYAGPSHPVHP